MIEAARRAGADAIHPGYGFLSENADFARAVLDAGLTWVGPAPDSIERMGSKVEAKKLMEAAGVPVLGNLAVETATEADLPLLVKASAGGGGRGMRIVRALADLPGEVEKASAEAESAFGDGTVFVEPYVERGRHVEVQVVGTADGVLVLGERDCSIQRRHQKVVEETPAPRLPDDDPRRAARRRPRRRRGDRLPRRRHRRVPLRRRRRPVLLPGDEHPAPGRAPGHRARARRRPGRAAARGGRGQPRWSRQVAQQPSRDHPTGHAIEVRLYAEDPAADWQPQSGRLTRFEIPEGDGIRVDSGFETGSEVSTHYDAMLAKVIAHAPTREQAARRLAGALSRARIHGLVTNRDLLVRILRDEAFLAGEVSTAFLDGFETNVRSTRRRPPRRAGGRRDRAGRAGRRRRAPSSAASRSAGATSSPSRSAPSSRATSSSSGCGTRDGYVVDGFTVVAADAARVTLEPTACARRTTWPSPATRSTSTRRAATSG